MLARARSEALLGERLAMLHRVRRAALRLASRQHASVRRRSATTWSRTGRRSSCSAAWLPQLALAERNGASAQCPARPRQPALRVAGALFSSYRPVPSLLHGDLWGGNWGADDSVAPVVFDPAVYFGDREADIAMTRLFGGFGPRVLRRLPGRVGARPGGGDAPYALQPLPRAEPLQPVRRRLRRPGRGHDRSPAGRARPLSRGRGSAPRSRAPPATGRRPPSVLRWQIHRALDV